MLRLIVALALVPALASAQAAEVRAPALDRDYSGTIMLIDGLGIAALAAGGLLSERDGTSGKLGTTLAIAGAGTWLLGSSAAHLGYGKSSRSAISFGLRLGTPVVGATLSGLTAWGISCGGGECSPPETDDVAYATAIGFIAGGIAATVLDQFWLAKPEGREFTGPMVAPVLAPTTGDGRGAVAGLGGTF
ncbi:MAG: hypothetical protein KJO07_16265 [Deltaproteobacteria bacterium]|nr:hypothetical protein [Deltaproteobacteria bacterium]